jgi:hypothetical protein
LVKAVDTCELSVPTAVDGYVQFEYVRFCGNGNWPLEFAAVGLFQAAAAVDPVADVAFDVELPVPADVPPDVLVPDAVVCPELEACDEVEPIPLLAWLVLVPSKPVVPVWLAQAATQTAPITAKEEV